MYAFDCRSGTGAEDAADLTQSFFELVIRRDILSGLHRDGARFSTFLITVLRNHLRSQHARAVARKRGGGMNPRPDDPGSRILAEPIWINPHPEKTITTIDFVSGKASCSPILIAITLE